MGALTSDNAVAEGSTTTEDEDEEDVVVAVDVLAVSMAVDEIRVVVVVAGAALATLDVVDSSAKTRLTMSSTGATTVAAVQSAMMFVNVPRTIR